MIDRVRLSCRSIAFEIPQAQRKLTAGAFWANGAGTIAIAGNSGLPQNIGSSGVLFKELIKKEFLNSVRSAYPSASISDEAVKVDVPKLREHGEYAIAVFPLAKPLKQPPQAIAQSIAKQLEQNENLHKYFNVSAVGAYINFKFTDSFLLSGISGIDADFGKNDKYSGKKILVEYVSANPTGPLHIGHGRWAVLGDAICRLFEAGGALVTREFYINDAGAQIDRFRASVDAAAKGEPIPEGGYKGDYINDLAQKDGDPVQMMIDHQRATLGLIGANFDNWFSEKTLHEQNRLEQAIAILTQKGLTYRAASRESEDDEPNAEASQEAGEAVWFRTTQFGDDKDRVIIRADGRPTYFAADIAYHLDKIKRDYDLLINIFGADHHGYVARISAAIQALSDKEQAHQIIIGQLVKLVRGKEEVKMSKRKGTVIMFRDLIDEIGPDAVRIFMGSTGFDTPVSIDLDLAVKKSDENPVFYIQYAHARISNIILKAKEKGMSGSLPENYHLNPQERELLAQLYRFPDLVCESAEQRSIHRLLAYSKELAGVFHSFYTGADNKVVDESQKEISAARLAMVGAVRQVLKNSFALLGISAPDEMRREEETANL